MAKRFNNLEDVYNTLLAADSFSWDSLPATNKYRKYKEWKQDPEKRKLPDASKQSTGPRQQIGLYAFGLDFADANKIKTPISGRVKTWLDSQTGIKDACNFLAGDISGLNKNTALQPAKAHLAIKRGSPQSVTAAENKITGRAYKRNTGETYTVPFGPGAAGDREFAVQGEILAAASSLAVVSFTPERIFQV